MIRYLLILLLCFSMAFADTVNEVVPGSTYDIGALAGAPSATITSDAAFGSALIGGATCQFGKVVTATRHAALIFTAVPIPIGSTVDSVRFTFISGNTAGVNTLNARFSMEDTGSAAAMSDTADYNARSVTTATADWNDVPDWTAGTAYTFPSSGAASTTLATVIQEVIDRADWGGNGNLCFFLYDNGSSNSASRQISAEDNATYDPAEIDIWFTPPPASGPPDHYHGVAGVGVRHSPAGNSVLHKK